MAQNINKYTLLLSRRFTRIHKYFRECVRTECGCDLRAPFLFIFVSFLCRRSCRGISTAFVFVLAQSTCFLGRQHFLLKSGVFKISLCRATRRRQRHCHFRCWERFNKSLQNKGQHLKTKLKA
jgi:hypothetical protein